MGKKSYRARRHRSRSHRYPEPQEVNAKFAGIFLLLLVPLAVMLLFRLHIFHHPEDWKQARIVYQSHRRHYSRGSEWYILKDAEGKSWRISDPEHYDLERFAAEAEPGEELELRYYTWLVGNIVTSMEGYYDYRDAVAQSGDAVKTDGYVCAAVMVACMFLSGYIICQLDQVHHFLPVGKRK